MFRLSPLILFVACLLATAPARASDPTLAGFGHSEAPPVGDEWRLPEGVAVVGPIRGHTLFMETDCSIDPEEVRGSGDMVMLCLPLRYTPPVREGVNPLLPIKVTIPPGLIFIPDDISTQNGIVIKKFVVELHPGRTTYIPIGLQCLNVSRSASSPSDTFRIGPVTRSPGFLRLFALLETKRVPTNAMAQFSQGVTALQMAVYDLAVGKPISEMWMTEINALPNE